MDTTDRRRILQNISNLVDRTKYKPFVEKCREKSLISETMQKVIEENSKDTTEKHYKLFEKITKRGPTAYDTLLDILKDLDFMEAYKLLKPFSYEGSMLSIPRNIPPKVKILASHDPASATNNTIPEVDHVLEPYTKDVRPIEKISVQNASKFGKRADLPVYSMRSKNRGVFFLVNIIHFVKKLPRNGADVDRDNLITLFRGLGYTIFYYEDLTQKQFTTLLDELLESEYLRSTDSFVLGILTHGDYHEGVATIEFHDESYTNLDTVITKFQNHNCQQLINKPKIFLFPFCRGNVSDHGIYIQRRGRIERDHIGAEVTMSHNLPTYSDILICYATVPGFQTHRDPMFGSWYIQSMCKIWSARAHDTDVEDLVKMVGYECSEFRCADSGTLQTDSRVSKGFNKLMYLNPGLFDD